MKVHDYLTEGEEDALRRFTRQAHSADLDQVMELMSVEVGVDEDPDGPEEGGQPRTGDDESGDDDGEVDTSDTCR